MPIDIPAARALYQDTTPGEWTEEDDWCIFEHESGTVIVDAGSENNDACSDIKFIAYAHNEMPTILSEIEALREALVGMIGYARHNIMCASLRTMATTSHTGPQFDCDCGLVDNMAAACAALGEK